MTITKEQLHERHLTQMSDYLLGKTRLDSPPIRLFDRVTGAFNPDNWNGGDAVIRQYTDSRGHGYTLSAESDIYDHLCLVTGAALSCQDEWHYTFTAHHVHQDGTETYDQYIVGVYKSRGCTQRLRKNGREMTLDEYVELLNLIEGTGHFTFKLGGKSLCVR